MAPLRVLPRHPFRVEIIGLNAWHINIISTKSKHIFSLPTNLDVEMATLLVCRNNVLPDHLPGAEGDSHFMLFYCLISLIRSCFSLVPL